jgi:hypothetical protein
MASHKQVSRTEVALFLEQVKCLQLQLAYQSQAVHLVDDSDNFKLQLIRVNWLLKTAVSTNN